MATPNLTGITSVIPGILYSAQLASGDNAVYTVGASKAAKLATMTLTNTSGAPVVLSVSVVPSGGTLDGTHKIVSAYSLAAGDTTTVSEVNGMWLGAAAVISVNASAGAAVDVVLTGLEFS